MRRRGGLPPMLDGPRLERFNAKQLAAAIKAEIARAHVMGWTKIQISMDLPDAFALARKLGGD